MDFVARITALLSSSLKKIVAFQLHPIVHIIILKCNTKKQQNSSQFFHAQRCQFIALYAPLLSLGILYHLLSENSSGSTSPSIPGQLDVKMFIAGEEKALGILDNATVDWRRQNNIPESDEVELG